MLGHKQTRLLQSALQPWFDLSEESNLHLHRGVLAMTYLNWANEKGTLLPNVSLLAQFLSLLP